MRSVRLALVPVMIAAVCVAPSTLHASGCNQDIVVPIQFSAGSTCWRHNGPGTTFNGQFAAHQHITASAIGEMYSAGGKVTTGPWQLSVTGPGGFSASDDGNGHLAATLPAAGKYSFSIGPCAVWGAPGTVEICTQ